MIMSTTLDIKIFLFLKELISHIYIGTVHISHMAIKIWNHLSGPFKDKNTKKMKIC